MEKMADMSATGDPLIPVLYECDSSPLDLTEIDRLAQHRSVNYFQ